MKRPSKTIFSLFCFCILATSQIAFGQGLAKKISGKWTGNVELTKKYWEKTGMEDTQRLLERIPKTSISFLKDGKLVVGIETPDGVAREITGKYSVTKTDEAKKELTLKFIPADDDNAPPEVEVIIKIQTDGKQTSLVIAPDNDPPVVFAKAKKSDKKKGEKKKADSPQKEADKKSSNK